MAKVASTGFSVSQSLTVPAPAAETAIVVSHSQWRMYMDRINKCGDQSQFWDSFGWAAVGAGIGGLFATLAYPASVSFEVVRDGVAAPNWPALVVQCAFVTLTLACLASGPLSLYFARQRRAHAADLRGLIVEDMRAHESRFAAQQVSGEAASN